MRKPNDKVNVQNQEHKRIIELLKNEIVRTSTDLSKGVKTVGSRKESAMRSRDVSN